MIITVGFTEPDHQHPYLSLVDGYRIGAPQTSVTIHLPGDGGHRSTQEWAEVVFTAVQHPRSSLAEPAPDSDVTAVRRALTDQVHTPLRSLSVGDTVTVGGQMWACESTGWRQVDPDGDTDA